MPAEDLSEDRLYTEDRLWLVADTAAYLGLSVKTVREWQQHGRIPFLQLGRRVRFDPAAVRRWAASNEGVVNH